jgi:hypothetical protein
MNGYDTQLGNWSDTRPIAMSADSLAMEDHLAILCRPASYGISRPLTALAVAGYLGVAYAGPNVEETIRAPEPALGEYPHK